MGYTTYFEGKLDLNKQLTLEDYRWLVNFNEERHEEDQGFPSNYCQWKPTEDGKSIVWDEREKFYEYVEWLEYLIKEFFKPRGYILNGTIGWEGNREVIDKLVQAFDFTGAVATEKLDGTNVRLTVRNHVLVRLEKRRNPDKIQKAKGIKEPWYVDADEFGPEDKYLWEAARNTDISNIPDGEWSGEALGPKIQGNPLNLEKHVVCVFTYYEAPIHEGVPTTFNELKEWLPKQQSKYGKGPIEGIVWHFPNGDMAKIKTKDFK